MEGFVSIALTAIVVLAIIFVKMAVVIIPQSETKIIERLGKYYDTVHRPRKDHHNDDTRTLCLL